MRTNKTKAKLAQGQPVFGFIFPASMPLLVELSAAVGMDFAMIDCEHGVFSDGDVEHMCRAAELVDVTPIIRVPVNREEIILKYLDRGAAGVIVPHVNTRADAEAAVRAAKYAPMGQRGFSGAAGARWGVGVTDPDPWAFANQHTLVIPMIEEEEGVRNAGEIAAAPGVAVVHIGPGDLAQSMGFIGRADQPQVQEAIRRVVTAVRAAGKAVGQGAMPPDNPDAYRQAAQQGVLFFTVALTGLLSSATRDFLRRARG